MYKLGILYVDMKAVIFDMDGVLVGTPAYNLVANNAALEQYGVQLTTEQNDHTQNYSSKKRIATYEEIFNIKIDIDIFNSKYIKTQTELIKEEMLDTKELIQKVFKDIKSRGLKIGLTTSAKKEKVDIITNSLGIRSYIDGIITSDDLENHKPHPDPYLKTALKLGVSPNECIVIEDSIQGVESAKNAKMMVLGLKTDFYKTNEVKDADHIINNLSEINEFLDKIDNS